MQHFYVIPRPTYREYTFATLVLTTQQPLDRNNLFIRFCDAVKNWLRNTPEGALEYDRAANDFNIADLNTMGWQHRVALDKHLSLEDIKIETIDVITDASPIDTTFDDLFSLEESVPNS